MKERGCKEGQWQVVKWSSRQEALNWITFGVTHVWHEHEQAARKSLTPLWEIAHIMSYANLVNDVGGLGWMIASSSLTAMFLNGNFFCNFSRTLANS
jgi:hypothetical protein